MAHVTGIAIFHATLQIYVQGKDVTADLLFTTDGESIQIHA
jgi:hypothetical protein